MMQARASETLAATLDLPPRLSAVAMLNEWYAERTADLGLSDRVRGDMKLCLNEAVANVVSYAFDGIDAPRLRVTLWLVAGGIAAEIRDNGLPFDPLAGPAAEAMHGMDTAQIGGFGIKLIRETAQELSYARVGQDNVLRLTCRADPGSAAPAR